MVAVKFNFLIILLFLKYYIHKKPIKKRIYIEYIDTNRYSATKMPKNLDFTRKNEVAVPYYIQLPNRYQTDT